MASTDTSTGHTYREMKLQHGRRGNIFTSIADLTQLRLRGCICTVFTHSTVRYDDLQGFASCWPRPQAPDMPPCHTSTQWCDSSQMFPAKIFSDFAWQQPIRAAGTKVSEAQRSFKFCRRRKSSKWEGIICKSSVLGLWLCPVFDIHPSIGIMENGDKTLTCLEIINNNIWPLLPAGPRGRGCVWTGGGRRCWGRAGSGRGGGRGGGPPAQPRPPRPWCWGTATRPAATTRLLCMEQNFYCAYKILGVYFRLKYFQWSAKNNIQWISCSKIVLCSDQNLLLITKLSCPS